MFLDYTNDEFWYNFFKKNYKIIEFEEFGENKNH